MKVGLIVLNIYLFGTSALTASHHPRSNFPLGVEGYASSLPNSSFEKHAALMKRATGRAGDAGPSQQSNRRASGQNRHRSTSASPTSSSSSSDMSSDSSDSSSERPPRAHAKVKVKGGNGGGELGKFNNPLDMDYHDVQRGNKKKLKTSGDTAGVVGNVGPGGYIRATAKGQRISYSVETSHGGTARLTHLVDGRASVQHFPTGTGSAQRLPNPGGGRMQANLIVEGTGQGTMIASRE